MKARAKKRLNLFDRIILWLTVFCCVLLVISYLSPVTDPQKYWLIAFFGLAYPILLLVNVILVLYWILRNKWFVMLIPLLCIIAGWSVLNKNIGLRFPASAKGPSHKLLRVMTYNVHNFKRYGEDNDVSTRHEILDLVIAQQPDVATFEEYYTKFHGEYDMTDSISTLGVFKHYYVEPIIASSTEAMGMAIFSKYPIINKGYIHISDKFDLNQCLYVDIKKDSTIIRVYDVHLRSIGFDAEDYKYINAISKQGSKPDINSTKRLGSKLKSAFIKRSQQIVMVRKSMAACPYPYIITGDFNDTPTSYAVNEMSKGLKNAFCEKGSGLGRTYNGNFPNYQIDYIMASHQFNVESYQIIEKKLSDHYPVCSDLILK